MQVKIDTKILSMLISSAVVVVIFSVIYSLSNNAYTKKIKPYTPDLDLEKIDSSYSKSVNASIDKKEISTTPLKKDSFNEESFFIDWSYKDQKAWPTLSQSFLSCKEGVYQSPIDIVKSKTIQSKLDFSINYTTDTIYLSSNNREFKIRPSSSKNYINFQNKKYILEKIDIHAPSEHSFNSMQYELELEFFHSSASSDTLILSVIFEKSDPNPLLDPIISNLPEKFSFETKIPSFNLAMLVKSDSFYYYTGSLSIPPCTQGIKRIVAEKIQPVSEKQLDIFHTSFPYGNSRDTQKLSLQQDILYFSKQKGK